MTTGKAIALTKWTFVGKVMSLLFNMLSRLVITFLPRSKCLLVIDTKILISYNFQVTKYYSSDFFQPFKNAKTFLGMEVIQKQFGPLTVVCQPLI